MSKLLKRILGSYQDKLKRHLKNLYEKLAILEISNFKIEIARLCFYDKKSLFNPDSKTLG